MTCYHQRKSSSDKYAILWTGATTFTAPKCKHATNQLCTGFPCWHPPQILTKNFRPVIYLRRRLPPCPKRLDTLCDHAHSRFSGGNIAVSSKPPDTASTPPRRHSLSMPRLSFLQSFAPRSSKSLKSRTALAPLLTSRLAFQACTSVITTGVVPLPIFFCPLPLISTSRD